MRTPDSTVESTGRGIAGGQKSSMRTKGRQVRTPRGWSVGSWGITPSAQCLERPPTLDTLSLPCGSEHETAVSYTAHSPENTG